MQRSRLLAGIAAAAIAAGAGITGHEIANPSAPVPCHQGPGCVVDSTVPPSNESALSPDQQLGATERPLSLLGAGSNGHLSLKALSPATGGHPSSSYPGTGQLANAPAAAWNAFSVYAHRHGRPWPNSNGSDSMYRPYARQVYWRNYWCSQGLCQNAAVPGTSNHGLGWAVDTDPATQQTIRMFGARFGWSFSCSDAPWESWHVKWCGGWSGKDPGPYGKEAFHVLKRGSHGKAVLTLSARLALLKSGSKRHPHFLRWSNRSSTYGKPVAFAVRRFQRAEHLSADGQYGPKTDAELRVRWRYYAKHNRRGHH